MNKMSLNPRRRHRSFSVARLPACRAASRAASGGGATKTRPVVSTFQRGRVAMDAKSISNPARHHESLRAEQIRADANRLRIQKAAGVDRESAVPCIVPAQGVE